MGKLAPARVSPRDDLRDFVSGLHDDWVISYHVYIKTELKSQTWIDYNYACATRSSLPANRLHSETSDRFTFT